MKALGETLRRILSGLVLSALVTATLVVTSGPASAVQTPQVLAVNPDPANFTPHVLDGEVYAVAEVGNTIVLGGVFTRARNAPDGSPELARTNILSFNKITGAIHESFAPVPDGVVRTLAPAGDGTSVYVGGQFNAINGTPAYKVARLDVITGARIAGFNPGLINAIVYDVKLNGDRLFIGGAFTSIKGNVRTYLAELHPDTGALRPKVNLSFTGVMWGGGTQVFKLDVTPDGRRMVVIGNFRTVGTTTTSQVALIDLTANPAVATTWSSPAFDIKCGSGGSTKFDVRDVDFSPDGSYFAIGATGGHTYAGAVCDGVSRWETNRSGPGQQPTWLDLTGGDSVYSVAVTGTAIYVGGHFRWLNNPVYVQSYKGPGAVDREGIAAVDPVSGLPLRWNPGRDRGQAVWDMVATADGLWIGNDTERIGRYEYHARNAFFPLAGGTPVPQPAAYQLPVDVHLISPLTSNDRLVRRRGFDGSSAGAAEVLTPAGTGWSAVRGAFLAEGSLYTVRTDKTMTKAPVNGASYGTPTNVDLFGLSAFANELPNVTSMFYAEGRLYYTLATKNELYMRFFAVESDVVGATRYTVTGGQSGLDWRLVKGAFLVDGALYWAHSVTGVLNRTTWANRAPVSGTSTVANGGDWKSAGMFVAAATTTPTADIVPTCVGTRCTFDAVVTGLGDSQVTSYAWTFGDGGTANTGPRVGHEYAPGSYTVGLTITTDQGVSAGATEPLTLTNAAPVAVLDVVCAGLDCTFDGTGSTDTDGTVTSYAWDFGDGGTATGATATHSYGTSGSHPVTLTVLDNRGASGIAAGEAVTAASAITNVATAANTQQQTVTTRSVVVPAGVQAGDTMLLFWSSNVAAAPTAPAGWTAHGVASTSASTTGVWSRLATAADAGSTVSVTTSNFVKSDLVVTAYRGAAVAGQVLAAETQSTANHKAPDTTVTDAGSWVVSYWADKSGTTAAWTAPRGTTTRHTYAGTGAGHVSELLTDSGGPVPVGAWTGLTATASSAALHATMATVVLRATG